MRILRDHQNIQVNPEGAEINKGDRLNNAIRVEAQDEDAFYESGERKASWSYTIYVKANNFSQEVAKLRFQHAPLKQFLNGLWIENQPSGISVESLLTICADRLKELQRTPYPCEGTKAAIDHIQRALKILLDRQVDRMSRGVEGQWKL